ncbi:MAG TPA: STAS domain-containing protein [Rectinemataceae bacterium]|nr:STAS domain-containing protein [Rectinemataceae bacterium]
MGEGQVSVTRLSPQGNLGIEKASSLRAEILDGFSGGAPVEFDFSGIGDLDLPCLQVLYAARREAIERDLHFRLSGSVSPRIARRLKASGFVNALPESGAELEGCLLGWAKEGS